MANAFMFGGVHPCLLGRANLSGYARGPGLGADPAGGVANVPAGGIPLLSVQSQGGVSVLEAPLIPLGVGLALAYFAGRSGPVKLMLGAAGYFGARLALAAAAGHPLNRAF